MGAQPESAGGGRGGGDRWGGQRAGGEAGEWAGAQLRAAADEADQQSRQNIAQAPQQGAAAAAPAR